ncbi:Xaa-Pro dipeptidase [Haloechinothrix alba]|uniref:Xaa-Pro dipeptidase n=2 Tax=Haloechinothrix alba TaxID=664784 RepID=A0A238ZGJ2_9PSEU|nr:Xaa-Pro dipeptidase [Haloechinothrix alba]
MLTLLPDDGYSVAVRTPSAGPAKEGGATGDDQQRTDFPAYASNVTGLDSGPGRSWLTADAIAAVRDEHDRAFDDAEYEQRLTSVRDRMARGGMDAMLAFRPSSVEYLCGYHTAETAPQPLLVTGSATYLYVPDLELGRALASARVDNVRYCGYADALRGLEAFLEHAAGVLPAGARVGIEVGHASTPPHAVEYLRGSRVTVVRGEHLVETVRLRLSEAEVRCVAEAAEHTRAGVDAAVAAAREPEATDSSVAGAISAALFDGANSASAWGPVVATGVRGGIPHSSWSHRRLGPGTTFLEFSGAHHRYHAPVMRTLAHGPPGPDERVLAELAETAVAAVLDTARAGVSCADVANAAAAALGPLPDGVVFHHLFGYPVGLAHKPHWMDGAPFYITRDNPEPLEAGMVFHIPASFRYLGRCGVGLSQTFLVTETGARVLTHGAAQLTVL